MAKKKTTTKKANKGGRPTAYKPEYAKEAFEYCAIFGADDKMLAKKFGVAESTLYLWKLKHNEFSEALKAGKEEFDTKNVEKALRDRALGYEHDDVHISNYQGEITVTPIKKKYPPDTTACIFWLKNRQPDKWRDKQELEHSGNLEINIVNYGDNNAPI
jgi:transposase-like protein